MTNYIKALIYLVTFLIMSSNPWHIFGPFTYGTIAGQLYWLMAIAIHRDWASNCPWLFQEPSVLYPNTNRNTKLADWL